MNFTHFTVQKDDNGRRLDRLVRKFLENESLSRIHKSIRSGVIRVNGIKKDASWRVSEGDSLDIADFLLSKKTEHSPSDSEDKAGAESETALNEVNICVKPPLFTDIFRNNDIRIINKPYGLSVQGGNGLMSADKLIKDEYSASHRTSGNMSLSFKPGPLHRIDRRTSGLICFSQSLRGARWFSEALAEKRIRKEYLALLEGCLTQSLYAKHIIERTSDSGTGKTRPDKKFKTVRVFENDSEMLFCRGKKAASFIEPIAHGRIEDKKIDCTLVRVTIETGRTHQIRAQSAFCGFPLLGDTAYGAKPFRFPDKKEGQRLFLHARTLFFPEDNPLNVPSKISAPLPLFFQGFIKKHLPAAGVSTYTCSNEIH